MVNPGKVALPCPDLCVHSCIYKSVVVTCAIDHMRMGTTPSLHIYMEVEGQAEEREGLIKRLVLLSHLPSCTYDYTRMPYLGHAATCSGRSSTGIVIPHVRHFSSAYKYIVHCKGQVLLGSGECTIYTPCTL